MVGFGEELKETAPAKRTLGVLWYPIRNTTNGDSLIGRLVRPDSSDKPHPQVDLRSIGLIRGRNAGG